MSQNYDDLSDSTKALVRRWMAEKTKLDEIKKQESNSRKLLCRALWPVVKKGTYTLLLENGEIKNTITESVKVDQSAAWAVIAELQERFSDDEDFANYLLESIFSYKIAINLPNFESQPQEIRDIIGKCFTIKTDSPSIKVKSLSSDADDDADENEGE